MNKKAKQTSLQHLPPSRAFNALWKAAAKKFPGVELGYTGTDLSSGDNFMQEHGNPNLFVLKEAELLSAMAVAPTSTTTASYLFYIEGLKREVWQDGNSEKEARSALWSSLTVEDKNAVIQFECLDVVVFDASVHKLLCEA